MSQEKGKRKELWDEDREAGRRKGGRGGRERREGGRVGRRERKKLKAAVITNLHYSHDVAKPFSPVYANRQNVFLSWFIPFCQQLWAVATLCVCVTSFSYCMWNWKNKVYTIECKFCSAQVFPSILQHTVDRIRNLHRGNREGILYCHVLVVLPCTARQYNSVVSLSPWMSLSLLRVYFMHTYN